MPRAMWSGAISFGLVNVPIKLYTAARSADVRFNQLHAPDMGRIQMKRTCSLDGEEVPFGEIVKGYEVAPEQYVVVSQEELDALAPQVTRGIEIEEFVDLDEIDPVYFESSYYLAPDKGGAKPYALLLQAMRDANKVALGRMVLRQKQYLVALRPAGNALSMATLYFNDEVLSQSEIDGLPGTDLEFSEREVAMARQLIDTLAADFVPSKYRDDYREKLMEMIDRKAAGELIAAPEREEAPSRVVDLMAALEASIAAAKAQKERASA
ncbi:MAG: Ku protein [Chloroflexi bacterium]|nr:Ku protein [Chloroflexota bacterium]